MTTVELLGLVQAPKEVQKGGKELKVSILSKFIIDQAYVPDFERKVVEDAACYHHLRLQKLDTPQILNPLEGTYTQGVHSDSLEYLRADMKDYLRSQQHDIIWHTTRSYDGYLQRVSVHESQLSWLANQDFLVVHELALVTSAMAQNKKPLITKIPFTGARTYAKATTR